LVHDPDVEKRLLEWVDLGRGESHSLFFWVGSEGPILLKEPLLALKKKLECVPLRHIIDPAFD